MSKDIQIEKRSWPRVSLKSLLVLITLLAIAVISSGPMRQRNAVAGLRELGADITYSLSEDEIVKSWLGRLPGPDFVSGVPRVELVLGTDVEFPDVGGLGFLSGLEQLKIGGQLDADSFKAIRNDSFVFLTGNRGYRPIRG